MRLQTAALINQQATKRDVDQWMEDLLIRIQLRIIHPHNVIHQEGGRIGEDTRLLQPAEINMNKLLLDGFTLPNTPGGLPPGGLPRPLQRLSVRTQEWPRLQGDDFVKPEIDLSNEACLHSGGREGDDRQSASVGCLRQQKQTQQPETTGERRHYRRYAVSGAAELRTKICDTRSGGSLSDLSASGCYVQMYFPPVARTELKMTLEVSEVRILAEGIVRADYPGLGVGIEFTNVTDEYRQRLSELLHPRTS
jgi:PilZ domain